MKLLDHLRIIRFGTGEDWKDTISAWSGGRTLAYGSGREALLALLRIFPVESASTPTVLLPAMVPEGVISPFLAQGWQIAFYPLDEAGHPHLPTLGRLARQCQPQVAVLIHLFGVRRDGRAFRQAVGRHTFLIEDFAQTAFLPERILPGAPGDAFLFSLPKLCGLPDGGLLVLPGSSLLPGTGRNASPARSIYLLLRAGSLLCATLAWQLPATLAPPLRWLSIWLNTAAYAQLKRYSHIPHQMSRLSRRIWKYTPYRDLMARRIQQANAYHRQIRNPFIRQIAGDSDNPLPLIGYPIQVDDRADFTGYLKKEKIDPLIFDQGWDFLPPADPTAAVDFHTSRQLMNTHLLLPINPKFPDAALKNIIRVVNAYKQIPVV